MRNRRFMPSGPPPANQTAGAVGALFCAHHGELVRLALLMVGDLPTAEDVVQDVYASLHKRWSHSAAPDEVLPTSAPRCSTAAGRCCAAAASRAAPGSCTAPRHVPPDNGTFIIAW